MECQALGACPDESLPDLLDVLGRVSGEDGSPVHLLEMVIEGASYAKNVKGPQLRLVHDLQHLDSSSSPGTHANLQSGTLYSCWREICLKQGIYVCTSFGSLGLACQHQCWLKAH